MLKALAITALLFSGTVLAEGMSAHRDPNVSYKAYAFKSISQQQTPTSAYDLAVPIGSLNQTSLPKWDSMEDVVDAFEMLRDVRFLSSTMKRKFLRRDSWLYPDDGCYARAALARKNLLNWNFPETKKLFVFGNLAVQTNNSPDGSVSWWYHVVPVVAVGDQAYVLDPAIEPKRPLTLVEWTERMGGQKSDIKLSICDGGAYTPMNNCLSPEKTADESALIDQVSFLDQEWERLLELKRVPEKELGDAPPWSVQAN
jgi:hypothetical protein